MKARMALAVILVVAVTLLVAGCDYVSVAPIKTTGGGWFVDEDGHRVTFGFAAAPTADREARGQFQLIDHGNKTVDKLRMHGSFTVAFDEIPTQAYEGNCTWFAGNCTVNGTDGYEFAVKFCDEGEPGPSAGDHIELYVGADSGSVAQWYYAATLEGGNIQIHWPNPNKPSK